MSIEEVEAALLADIEPAIEPAIELETGVEVAEEAAVEVVVEVPRYDDSATVLESACACENVSAEDLGGFQNGAHFISRVGE